MYVPGRQSAYTWYGTRRPEEYKFSFKSFIGGAMKMAGPLMAMTPMGKLAGLAGGALGALGGGGGGGVAGDVLAAGAGAAAGYAMGGGGGSSGGMMGGAPGGSSGGGSAGGSGPITINNPPVKVNIQISGQDMAASSGVFAEEIGVPGMTDNTMGGMAEAEEEEAGGGGILGRAKGMFGGGGGDDDGGGKKSKRGRTSKEKGGRAAAAGGRAAARGGRGRGRYTEEFSGSGIIPQLEESDAPLLTFALIAILISLLCN